MSNIERHKTELLKKYLNKSISNAERHELEKLALDDPFLFEAMEGYTEVSGNHEEVLGRIKSRMGRGKDTEGLSFPYAIAASLLVLFGFSFFFWQQDSSDKRMPSLASKEEKTITVNTPMDDKPMAASKKKLELAEEVEMEPESNEVAEAVTQQSSKDKVNVPQAPIESKTAPIASTSKEALNSDFNDETELIEFTTVEKEQVVVMEEEMVHAPVEVKTVFDPSMETSPTPAASAPEGPAGVFANPSKDKAKIDEIVVMDADESVVNESDRNEISEQVVVAEKKKEARSVQGPSNKMSDQADSGMFNNQATESVKAYRDDFEKYLYENVDQYLSNQELKKIQKGVALQFNYADNQVSNFKVSPNQDPRVNALLLELVKGGVVYLENVDGIVEYVLF